MFTSYAQNFEDVLLWRALKDVRDGFYVDIGAHDPRVDSVSRGFYEKGWRGISVEPVLASSAKLRSDRPDETVFRAAVSAAKNDITFFEFRGTGLSTGNRTVAEMHVARGLPQTVTKVPVMPLSAVLDAAGGRDVQWLKIDVEGMEEDVIASWGDCQVRPWIVLVESTLPTTQRENFAAWEPHLLARGYQFVYFDGLSRYYCLEARPDLVAHFGPGPNVFDAFQISFEARAPGARMLGEAVDAREGEIAQLEATVQSLTQELASTRAAYSALKAQGGMSYVPTSVQLAPGASSATDALRLERDSLLMDRVMLEQLRSSTSWKVTAPLRAASRVVNGEGRDVARRSMVILKKSLRPKLVSAASYLNGHPKIRQWVVAGLDKVPPLRDRLRGAMARSQAEDSGGAPK